MSKRITIVSFTILGLVLVGGILVFFETGWPLARFKGGIRVTEAAVVRVSEGNETLNPAQTLELRALFGRLLSVDKAIYSKPDFEVVVQSEGGRETQFSIWVSEKFVYEGHYLEAWSERMTGDRATGFRLGKDVAEFLGR